MIMRSEVVLPAPLGPSRPKTAPSLIRKLKLLTAVSVSNRFVTPSRTTASIAAPVLPAQPRGAYPANIPADCSLSNFVTFTQPTYFASKQFYVYSIEMHWGAITNASSSQAMGLRRGGQNMGGGVIWHGIRFETPVNPAKAGIQSFDNVFPKVFRVDSRFRGNDCSFERPCLANDTS